MGSWHPHFLVLILLVGCVGAPKPGGSVPPESAPPSDGDSVHSGGDSDSAGGTTVPLTQIADDVPASAAHNATRRVNGTGEISDDGQSFVATVDYWWERDGVVRCDAQIGLSGTLVSGVCEQCDYAFKLDAEVLEDDGDYTCDMHNGWTSLTDGYYVNIHLGFGETYDLYFDDRWQPYNDVLLTGYGIDHDAVDEEGGYLPGPYWSPLIWEGPLRTQGWAELEDNQLTWGFEDIGDYYSIDHYLKCGTARMSDATEGWFGGSVVTGQVDCARTVMDGWTVEAKEGDIMYVTVDAPTSDTYFTPFVFVNGPDGCAMEKAMENYTCTGMEDFSTAEICAAISLEVATSGTHEIWVSSWGTNCRGGPVDYALYVDLLSPTGERLAMPHPPLRKAGLSSP